MIAIDLTIDDQVFLATKQEFDTRREQILKTILTLEIVLLHLIIESRRILNSTHNPNHYKVETKDSIKKEAPDSAK